MINMYISCGLRTPPDITFIENNIKAKIKIAVTVFFSLFCATDKKLPLACPFLSVSKLPLESIPATKLSNDSLIHCTIIEVIGIGDNDLLPA